SLPVNTDPHKADLKDPDERRRLARVLERGLGEPAGYVLPLKPAERAASKAGDATLSINAVTWVSSLWPLKREHLYLVAGDSPLGLRLPLSTLPWVLPEEMEQEFPVDPFEQRRQIDDPHAHKAE